MSKWTHVFRGPGEDGLSVEVSFQAEVTPQEMALQEPRLWTDPKGIKHAISYVGSGKGDYWTRTANPLDPLVTDWMSFFRPKRTTPLP
jgi:hypothetical protein